jgi:L-rhamnose mutarotase
MTAEIVIMNKEAVALAADSAVTIDQEKEQKIFTSANKLFALSKYYPVGLMVYGNASLMGVPWETIIKIYRKLLGEQKFDTLRDYADNFISFLDNGNKLFPDKLQKKYFFDSISSYFHLIRNSIENKIKADYFDKEKPVFESQVMQITSDLIKEHYNDLEEKDTLPSITENYTENILINYSELIEKAKDSVFEKLPISEESINQLKKISIDLLSKDIFPNNISGIVIAGFGENDIFPSIKSFDIEYIVNNRLKYKERLHEEINYEKTAAIIPFAQKEMVATFMEGIDPFLQIQMEHYLSELFNKYPEIIIDNIEKVDPAEKEEYKEKLKKISNEIFENYLKQINIFKRTYYIKPVISVVNMLPKDELASMAESLVNLTSFKRKVTMVTETVGGPIDVAIISKGDGFIWIKRKHYFKAELNPQFISNYNRR